MSTKNPTLTSVGLKPYLCIVKSTSTFQRHDISIKSQLGLRPIYIYKCVLFLQFPTEKPLENMKRYVDYAVLLPVYMVVMSVKLMYKYYSRVLGCC